MTSRQRADIALHLGRRSDGGRVARLVSICASGGCTECGDVCPLKAARWRRQNVPAIKTLFSTGSSNTIWKVRLTHGRWSRKRGELSRASPLAIEKYLRRVLDNLGQTATVAVGVIDAWYGWRQWELGAEFLVAGPSKSQLFDAFSFGVTLLIEEVEDVGKAAKALLVAAHRAKLLPPYDALEPEPKSRRRGEYYAWLASCPARSRLFRYGCDRYFHPLKKSKRQIVTAPKKGHPYPRWLEKFMFGNHHLNCQCIACGGLGLNYIRDRDNPTLR
jgi:hypothetical protein